MGYNLTDTNLHLFDSAFVSKAEFRKVLVEIKSENRERPLFIQRTVGSMVREWTCHNFLYSIGYKRERTRDCDLNIPQSLAVRLCYAFFGIMLWVFVK